MEIQALIDRLEVIKAIFVARSDDALVELVQILIDGFQPVAEPGPPRGVGTLEGSQGLLKMEAASEEHGGEA